MKYQIILSLLFTFLTTHVYAQDHYPQPWVTAESVTIHSKILNEDRNLVIYDPDKYGANRLPSYPVLYMLDENDVTMVAGMVRYLSAYTPRMSPMLVVGIDGGQSRIRDLTPTHSLIDNLGKLDRDPNSWLKDSGGSERFTLFLRDEVMPYIKKHYKAGPFTMLGGHSVGGLETIYCLDEHPSMFNAYFAISPALWWDKGCLIARTKARLNDMKGWNKFLFLADCPETGPFSGYIHRFDHMIRAGKPSSLHYLHTFYPTENHGTIVVKAYYDAMRYIYPEWDVADSDTNAALIVKHYNAIGQRLGYNVQPPQELVEGWAEDFMASPKTVEDALVMYKLNIRNFPNDASGYQSLGDACAKIGRLPDAIAALKTAHRLAPNNAGIARRISDLEAVK